MTLTTPAPVIPRGPRWGARNGCALALLLLGLAACGAGPADPSVAEGPPGRDVSVPFPIDRGDESAATPGSYKGLPLRLVSRGAPTVTPVNGLVGVVCVGMSNAAQECNRWVQQVTGAWRGEVRGAVRIVNCSVGAHAIERWIDPAFDPTLWDDCVQRRVPASGLTLDQVRVIYHKAANQFGGSGGQLPPYPSSSANFHLFHANLGSFAARVRSKFPNVQAVYTTPRSYGGYAGTGVRGEPQAYEEGHALNRWLAENPSVDGVWYGWGPYIWAPDCSTGEANGAGICYVRTDYRDDGVHPTADGELKIARMIHERFRREAWYRP
jgi:hypothetical protein